jgi:4-amino-4-deoxy-L-arabinose transferase-like glycosyltransferase
MRVCNLALAIMALGLALAAQQLAFANPSGVAGWALLAGATCLMAFAVPAAGQGAPVIALETRPAPKTWAPLCGMATMVAVTLATVLSSRDRLPILVLLLWISSAILGAVALRSRNASAPARAQVPWSRLEVAGFGGIILLAVVARVLWIDTLPPAYFGDESRVGMFLRNAYKVAVPNFFTMGWNNWAVMGLSLQGILAPVLGLRINTLRLASALFGSLAVGATYLLARELFTRRTAIFAALLLAVCRTAINFSRLGVCHVQVMFFETAAFFCWWRGINTGRAAWYWWAGVGLGLGLLTYNAGDLAPLLWLGWLGLSVLFVPRSARVYWRGAVITAAGFLVVAYPWLHYITDHLTFGLTWEHWTIIARNRQAMSQALDAWHAGGAGAAAALLWRQVWLTWLGFGVLPAGAYPELGYRGGGMLDNVSAPLFVLGLGLGVSRLFRHRGGFVVYWWLLTVIVGGVLTLSPPAFVRLVAILPAMAILAALPLEALVHLGEALPARTRIGVVSGSLLAGALLVGAGWDNWRTYFVQFARASIDDTSELAHSIKRLPLDAEALLVGAEHFLHFTHDANCELFAFEFPDRHLEDVPDPSYLLPLHQPVTTPLAIVLGPSQITLTPYIRELYPHAEVADAMRGTDQLMFRMLRVQPDDVTRRTGLRQTVYDDQGMIVSTALVDPFDTEPGPSGGRVLWTGSIYWPTDKPVTLRIRVSVAQPETRIMARLADSVEWQISPGPRPQPGGSKAAVAGVPVTLARGWQPVRVEARGMQGLSIAIQGGDRALTRWDARPEDTPEGLAVVYQRNGETITQAVDTQLNAFAVDQLFRPPHLRMPFAATWEGALRIVTPGDYKFEALGSGPYSVSLDGKLMLHVTDVIPEQPSLTHASRSLNAGLHPIVAHWDSTKPAHTNRRIFQVFWTPPDGERQLIPPSAFLRPTPERVPVEATAVSLVPQS